MKLPAPKDLQDALMVNIAMSVLLIVVFGPMVGTAMTLMLFGAAIASHP